MDSEADSITGAESDDGGEAAPTQIAAEKKPAGRQRNHPLRAAIVLAVGVGLIWLIQWFAAGSDHQNVNLLSFGIGFVTAIALTLQLHFWARSRGHGLLVPAGVVALIVAAIVLFRIDGFSGEMLPQIKFRFAKKPPEMRFLTSNSKPGAAGEGAAESVSSRRLESQNSLGFLGSDRTGVIGHRRFDVPTDVSQVETLWNQGIGEGWSSFAVSGDRAVTLEQREGSECVSCYRLSDGQLLWIETHQAYHYHPLGGAGPRSTPTIVGDDVYAQGSTGRVWCLNLQTGEVHWTVDLLELAGWDQPLSEKAISWGRAGSPLVVDDLCIVPFGGPERNQKTGRSLIAFDRKTGETRWVAGKDQISYASPGLMTLGGQRQIVSVNEKTVTGHMVEDGSVLWEFEWPGQSNAGANCAMAVPAGKDRFLVGKGYGGGSALVEVRRQDDAWSAEAVWVSARILKTKFTHACVDGDLAYAISNGSLEAVSIAEAEQLWRQPRRNRLGQGQILLVEDTIVAQSESGDVVLIAADPDEYRELIRLPAMSSKTWNIPTVAGRHLLVRNDRRAICFRLPPRDDGGR